MEGQGGEDEGGIGREKGGKEGQTSGRARGGYYKEERLVGEAAEQAA